MGGIKRAVPGVQIVGSALSYPRQFAGNLAAGAIGAGIMDAAGFGRLSFAYPEFARDLLSGAGLDRRRCCVACGKCSQLMRMGSRTGCVVARPGVYESLQGVDEEMKALSGKGRAALVTGARRGIGLGIAKALLAEGYAVLLCGVTEEPRATADIAPELTRLGTWAYLRCDVSDAQDPGGALCRHGGEVGRWTCSSTTRASRPVQRLDVLETTAESFERLLRVNTESCFFMCQAGAKRMLAGKGPGHSRLPAADHQHLLGLGLHLLALARGSTACPRRGSPW